MPRPRAKFSSSNSRTGYHHHQPGIDGICQSSSIGIFFSDDPFTSGASKLSRLTVTVLMLGKWTPLNPLRLATFRYSNRRTRKATRCIPCMLLRHLSWQCGFPYGNPYGTRRKPSLKKSAQNENRTSDLPLGTASSMAMQTCTWCTPLRPLGYRVGVLR